MYTRNVTTVKKRDVIIYIHPGGFYVFSGRTDVFGPQYLMDHDIVLVTINYRLGLLGKNCLFLFVFNFKQIFEEKIICFHHHTFTSYIFDNLDTE